MEPSVSGSCWDLIQTVGKMACENNPQPFCDCAEDPIEIYGLSA